ncbi:hypothetical protein Pla123a_11500 [Posidoniimonas polymericola]|uniref:Probable inorganic carbon transporter subunit DabA n=1 Tax=Posidoniimonas polymericola TaxID=2528002 RepID=A0A5C5YTN6_9BACT|nr:DUF2309 domain-containing protein [Posidoniimonas polymericola]TWT78359.1 hypothetical protein Pla123a_11500 [Posidoniimonas polymericola]
MTTLSSQPQPALGPRDQSPPKQPSTAVYEALTAVQNRIAPVWPLKDYVAVNPYLGYATQDFLGARHTLRSVSDVELLMSGDYYRQQFDGGSFSKEDIEAAVDELVAAGVTGSERIDVNQVLAFLAGPQGAVPTADADFTKSGEPNRAVRTLAETYDSHTGSNWSRRVCEAVSQQCASHYDQGQAVWQSGWRELPLYQAWRAAAQHNRTFEILGVRGFRRFVSKLPNQPQDAVAALLSRLGVPEQLWTDFLLCEALATPGWTAWTRRQDRQLEQQGRVDTDLVGLLAMRLAHEVALAEHFDFRVDWDSVVSRHNKLRAEAGQPSGEALLRYALLRACEIAFRKQIVGGLQSRPEAAPRVHDAPALAQMVFCIDVRSERVRRRLEAASSGVETYGFAGFFGLPIEFLELGEQEGSPQVPVLISPKFRVYEELETHDQALIAKTHQRRALVRLMRKTWKGFQASAISAFAFVETAGMLYGLKLIARTLRLNRGRPGRFDGVRRAERDQLAPSLAGLPQQGVGPGEQVDMAESILRGIGIVDNFARLVAFCGHGSQTENNPLKAGLDCGACGGHSGESNARLAAKLLNQPHVRLGLAERGIAVPADTRFVAALHNTTTDKLQFFDLHQLPPSHEDDLQQLQRHADLASQQTAVERLATLPGRGVEDLVRRSLDWSEVRPEWGLAGNAAFIAAPRDLTKRASLDGRVFLHSYDWSRDEGFAVLEQIMTAPLVVANWINMQYYASTVDPVHFGSGNKTVHNVVGQFGVLSGNGGDLMTGLPWQSVHDGAHYQHHPLRLLGMIAAPRAAIEGVLAKHREVSDLVSNGWMQLVAIEDGVYFRYSERQQWEPLSTPAGLEPVA